MCTYEIIIIGTSKVTKVGVISIGTHSSKTNRKRLVDDFFVFSFFKTSKTNQDEINLAIIVTRKLNFGSLNYILGRREYININKMVTFFLETNTTQCEQKT